MSGGRIVALAGGVGGARLARGLLALLGDRLCVIANTGDDFRHMGLHVSPDIDTLLYTLSGRANAAQGWGLADESWAFMEQARLLGLPDWFALGDRDLAMHVMRSHRLAQGETLSAITADAAKRLGITARILPMSDDPAPTRVETDEGALDFQNYFVERRCEPRLRSLHLGAASASIAPAVREALSPEGLAGIIICPSNPWLSIAPILAVPGLRALITGAGVPVIAVSPLIGGKAVKGPAAKIMAELGQEVSAAGIATLYAGLADHLVIDEADRTDAGAVTAAGLSPHVAPTLMSDAAASAALARVVLDIVGTA